MIGDEEHGFTSYRTKETVFYDKREWNALGKLTQAFRANVRELRGNAKSLRKLAEKHGYKVKGVVDGYGFLDEEGELQIVGDDNKARIGPGKNLYVVVNESGKVEDVEGFRHDVGACVLGGKHTSEDETSDIRFETFASLVLESSGMKIDKEEWRRSGRISTKKGVDYVHDTYVLDELVGGGLKYGALKYMGMDWEDSVKKKA